jgi:hypothetical protein
VSAAAAAVELFMAATHGFRTMSSSKAEERVGMAAAMTTTAVVVAMPIQMAAMPRLPTQLPPRMRASMLAEALAGRSVTETWGCLLERGV